MKTGTLAYTAAPTPEPEPSPEPTPGPIPMPPPPLEATVEITEDAFVISVAVPFERFSRLRGATPEQRRHFELIGGGRIIHWPDVDEDIEVGHLLIQPRSGE
jgi:hypothetical protein